MSWEATAYVKGLKRCPDGAELGRGQKLLLFVLADCHNPHKRVAWPSVPSMAEDALTSLPQVKRDLVYLEEHCVLRKIHPEKPGRGHFCSYVFLAIDEPEELKRRLERVAKGVHHEPFSDRKGVQGSSPFCPAERGSKGVHPEQEKGSEGVHGAQRNKEEPMNQIRTPEQAQSAAPSARVRALRAKHPQVVQEFERQLSLIYEAQVGSRESWTDDPFERWKRDADAAMVAAKRCRLPIEIGLALANFSDHQILLLTRLPRGPDEQAANVQAAFALGEMAANQ